MALFSRAADVCGSSVQRDIILKTRAGENPVGAKYLRFRPPNKGRNVRQINRSVVIGTIGADAHMIGGWVLQKAFQDAGFTVAFLGAVVPQEEFINAAIEIDADAILVSSMYGMGLLDCEGLRDKCIEAGLDHILLYVGGTVAAPLELEKNIGDSRISASTERSPTPAPRTRPSKRSRPISASTRG
jgi:methylaspartate mutase sigma subunit